MVSAKPRPRCEMTGEAAADGYKHLGRNGAKRNFRCTNEAVWRSGHQLFCDACDKHVRELGNAQIAVGRMRLAFVRTAKRLRPC